MNAGSERSDSQRETDGSSGIHSPGYNSARRDREGGSAGIRPSPLSLTAEISTRIAFREYRQAIEAALGDTLEGVWPEALLGRGCDSGEALYRVEGLDVSRLVSLASALEQRLGADPTAARGVTLAVVAPSRLDSLLEEKLTGYLQRMFSYPATDSILGYEMRRPENRADNYASSRQADQDSGYCSCSPPVLEMDGIFTARLYPLEGSRASSDEEVWLAHATISLGSGESVDLQTRAPSSGEARWRLRRAVEKLRVMEQDAAKAEGEY